MDVGRRVYRQYEEYPYPGKNSAKEISPGELYLHSVDVPFFLRDQRLVDVRRMKILDAGCGTGRSLVALARANHGASVTGIDPSSSSTAIAREYTQRHSTNVDIFDLDISRVTELGTQFDYINCSDVLYLVTPQHDALLALRAVLADDGLMRCNFHSYHDRYWFYRAQELFSSLGVDSDGISRLAIQRARSAVRAMTGRSPLKRALLAGNGAQASDSRIINNWMLQGDRGTTIDSAIKALDAAGLRFLSMINRHAWQWRAVFDEHAVDSWLRETLESMTRVQELRICELVSAPGRLLDMWCDRGVVPFHLSIEKQLDDPNVVFSVHSAFRTDVVRGELTRAIAEVRAIQLNQYIPWAGVREILLPEDCLMLLMLGEGPLGGEAIARRLNSMTSLRNRVIGSLAEHIVGPAAEVARRLQVFGAIFASRRE